MKGTLQVVKFLKRKRRQALEFGQKNGVEALVLDDINNDDDIDEEDDDGERKTSPMEIETAFSLQDTLYAKAKIKPAEVDEVYLWLGANVMVAYPLDEAEELLQGKLDKAKESLKAAEEDVEFLRVQITTLEVAVARVHNWDVGEKRRLRKEGKLAGEDGEKGKE